MIISFREGTATNLLGHMLNPNGHHLATIRYGNFAELISALKTAFGRCLLTVLSEGCNDDDLIV